MWISQVGQATESVGQRNWETLGVMYPVSFANEGPIKHSIQDDNARLIIDLLMRGKHDVFI